MTLAISASPAGPHASRRPCPNRACPGALVRHSLGCGLAVYRCTDCFRSAESAPDAARQRHGWFARAVHEFIAWREDDRGD